MNKTLYQNPKIERLLQDDPTFLDVYNNFVQLPWKKGHLEPKVKALLSIALSASPTHLNEQATKQHIELALHLGATKEEIAEVLKVVSILGVHTCAVGIPLMMEHFREENLPPYTPQQEARKQKFVDTMGYWNDFRDDILRLDEEFFDAYYEFLTTPIRRGILEPKVIEFIYIAIDASTTHLFESGIKVHLINAIQYGATQGEIFEVLQLTSAQGFDSLQMGLSILEETINDKE
ncbi:carboxymuconolactone decarboxylase family protein [Lysinibacillus endophyticus]|uniref:carboxymuconolactone decarboxylase family protein n=1 Tax=Ureibacillus endophyticus TaxID=1978490 RepID=UPI00313728B5